MTNNPPPKLILASGSRYRAELLRRLHLTFSQVSPEIDEAQLPGETAEALASRLASEKAGKIAESNPDSLVIGSDQVASLNGEILSKPGSIANAIRQLSSCSGKVVTFYTGLCVTGLGHSEIITDTFTVTFRRLSEEQIRRYVDKEQPLDCAGSFKVEGLGISLFEKLEGSDPNTLIGLPLIKLVDMLNQRGIEIP